MRVFGVSVPKEIKGLSKKRSLRNADEQRLHNTTLLVAGHGILGSDRLSRRVRINGFMTKARDLNECKRSLKIGTPAASESGVAIKEQHGDTMRRLILDAKKSGSRIIGAVHCLAHSTRPSSTRSSGKANGW